MLYSIQIFWTAAFFSRCPFLLNLDLIGIANRFDQFNLPAFALGTLLLIPSAQRKAQQIHVSVHVNPTPEKKQLQKSTFMFVLLYRLYHSHDLCLWDWNKYTAIHSDMSTGRLSGLWESEYGSGLIVCPCHLFQGFLFVCNPVAVLEQVDELMNTGELAGIPSQVRGFFIIII